MRFPVSILLICALHPLSAQSFQTHYGGIRHQDGMAAFPDAQGITVVVRDVPDTPGGVRVRLLHTDAVGAQQTWREVALPGSAFVHGAVQDGTAFVLCGSLIRAGRSDQDAFIVKVDQQGTVQWTWSTDTPASEEQLLAVQRMPDGRFAAAGSRRIVPEADADTYIAVVDAIGQEAWTTDAGNIGVDDEVNALVADAQGLTCVGRTAHAGMGLNAYVLRTDLTGAVQWSRERGGAQDDVARSIATLSDGTIVWAGYTDTYGDTDQYGRHQRNVYAMAMSATGDSLWERAYGDTLMHHEGEALAVTSNGDLLIGGKQYDSPDGRSLVMRIGANGALLWRRTYDVLGEEEVRYLVPLAANAGFIGCGWCFGEEGGDVLLLRKNATGD